MAIEAISLTDERRMALRRELQALYSTDFDESLSDFQADAVLECVIKAVGPVIYNQAVEDVRAWLQTRLDDLDGEVFA